MNQSYDQIIDEIGDSARNLSVPWVEDGAGITRRDTRIAAFVHQDAYADDTDRHRLLIAGGLSGSLADVEAVAASLDAYARSQRLRNRIALSAIPCANPDGLSLDVGPGNGSGGVPGVGYPPEGGFFNHATKPESRYIWRYIGFMAPDYVVEIRSGDQVRWEHTGAPAPVADALNAVQIVEESRLLAALATGTPNDLGRVPGLRLTAPIASISGQLHWLSAVLDARQGVSSSPARAELDRRRRRSPVDVAARLVERYGDTLAPIIYTQGVAISGRLRFGDLTGDTALYADGVSALVEPYWLGEGGWFSESSSGPNHAGIVWCDEMFEATGDARYRDLLVSTADKYMGGDTGSPPPPCDTDYRTEDMFFAGALLGRASTLTGAPAYLDTQTSFLLNAAIQQEDGLFWHCRSVPYHWGRGNGFAALGYAETLTHLAPDHPDRGPLLDMHTRHLDAIRGLQRPSGMLSQLLDFDGSYQELTATCMVGYATARGLRLGWLDESYRPFADSLWRAASERIGADGEVVDGCTGTGAVDDRRFYIDRTAEYGQDDRTGNLALWFAVEMERLRRGI